MKSGVESAVAANAHGDVPSFLICLLCSLYTEEEDSKCTRHIKQSGEEYVWREGGIVK